MTNRTSTAFLSDIFGSAILSLLATTAFAIGQSPQYQPNSDNANLRTSNYSTGDGSQAVIDLATVGDGLTVVASTTATQVSLAVYFGEHPVLSRGQGAYETPGGQLFNLPVGPATVFQDISSLFDESGNAFIPLEFTTPQVMSMQLVVTDDSHPDGFLLSAPLVVRWIHATGASLEGTLDPSNLSSKSIDVSNVHEPEVNQDPYKWRITIGSIDGSMTLTVPGYPTVTAGMKVDILTGDLVSSAGSPINNLGDVFDDIYPSGITATLQVSFDAPIALAIQGVAFGGPCLYCTDSGKEVPRRDDQFPNLPDVTPAQAATWLARHPGLVQTGPATDSMNCHGWVFGWGGGGVIYGKSVQCILDDNGYMPNPAPKVGDVVIYRKNGKITHSGKVTQVNAQGQVTEVEGKWGGMPRVKHAPGYVPQSYGTPTYYKTTRANDCLIWRC